jgi:hypothetical protein
MSEPIYVPPPVIIGKTLKMQIDEHNARVERVWLIVGSRCKPFNAKRAAYGKAALSELQRQEGAVEASFDLRSDGSSPTCLTGSYSQGARS